MKETIGHYVKCFEIGKFLGHISINDRVDNSFQGFAVEISLQCRHLMLKQFH